MNKSAVINSYVSNQQTEINIQSLRSLGYIAISTSWQALYHTPSRAASPKTNTIITWDTVPIHRSKLKL